MNTQITARALFAGLTVLATSTQGAELLLNGGFETPTVSVVAGFGTGSSDLSGWVVSLNSVEIVNQTNPFIVGLATEGMQYLDLDGAPGPGQISQTFSTTPGLSYSLTFDYANNYFSSSSASAMARVFDGTGDLWSGNVTHNTSSPTGLDWLSSGGIFTATAGTATLEFSSLSGPGSFGGVVLDRVSVQSVPEPQTMALAMFGLALSWRWNSAKGRRTRASEHGARS